MNSAILATAVVVTIAIIAAFLALRAYHRRRREGMAAFAAELNRPYAQLLPDVPMLAQSQLPVVRTSRHPDCIHAIDLAREGRSGWLFDYSYTVGRGRSCRRYFTTAYLLQLNTTALPAFSLQPRRFFHVIIDAVANDVIEFDEFPELSRHYLLRGNDPEAVRRLLHAGFAASLTSGPPIYHLECADSLAILYRAERRVRLDELAEFVRSAESFFALTEKAGPLLAIQATSSLG